MSGEAEREAARVRAAYARRAALGLDARYDYWQPANLFIYQSRERALLTLLRAAGMLPLTGRRVLDVGCGDGGVLRDLLRYGARAEDLHGVDLLPERVERARDLTPGARIEVGDAQALPYEDAGFDLVLGFTLLSSVVDEGARRRVAAEMARVTKTGGAIVVVDPDYDTQVVDVADQELARSVLRFRADHLLRNGTLAHQMGGFFIRAGLAEVEVEAATVVLRDPTALDNAMGLRSWASSAHERGLLEAGRAQAWERMIDDAIAHGHFLYSFTLFITAGIRQ